MNNCCDGTNFSKSDISDEQFEHYLMTPHLHKDLKQVNGFTNLNGDTYMIYIIIVLDKYLSSQQKIKIIECNSETQALNKLKSFGIKFTHNYELASRK